ncbi:MAG: sialidase-1 [Planctomycetota bacterium]|jgi:sialidase-1
MLLPLLLLMALGQDPTDAACGFEDARGPVQELATSVGRWSTRQGSVVLDAQHARTGSRSLHMKGGSGEQASVVELSLARPAGAGDELSFWAERWTRRAPFEFVLEAQGSGAWRRLPLAGAEIRIGGFETRIAAALAEGDLRVRLRCEAPAGTGILIDDVSITRATPMKLTSVGAENADLPVLLGMNTNPILHVVIETQGSLEPLTLEAMRFRLEASLGLTEIASVRLLVGDLSGRAPSSVGRGQEFGEAISVAAELLSFQGGRVLNPGTNHFWLSIDLKPNANIDGRVGASCSFISFANGDQMTVQTAATGAPARLGVALRKAGDDGVKVYRIPGLVTTPKGTLIAIYDARWQGSGDLPGDVDVGLSRSTDGGRSWEPMNIIMDMGRDPKWRFDGIGDPAVLVDRSTGRIFVIATWSHGDRSWRGSGPGLTPEETGQLMLVHSDDEGLSWSKPRNLTAMLKRPEWCFLLQGPGRGICMQDGTLVFPAQFQLSPDEKRLPHSTVITSPDHGETWQIGTGIHGDTTESAVVELEPGLLMLNARDNRGGSRSIYTSRNLGRTWSEHATSRKDLREPVCMASLIHVGPDLGGAPDGLLLFSNPDVARAPRRRITIKSSLDYGAHWSESGSVLLDAGNSAGYSCLSMIDAKTVGILYEGSRAQLCFQRIPLAEILQ